MEIREISAFLDYYKKIRARTMRVITSIPHEQLEWTYEEGKFTFGDLIRHLGSIERYMYAENAQFKPSTYPGHGEELASGYTATIQYLNDCHEASLAIFEKLTPEDLNKKTLTPAGTPITLWKWLRAMIEHEIHHRGQIFIYLGMIGEKSPPLYGLTAEEVQEKSKS
ncbi:MAG: DinB family protein [Bacteroidota bacterium]